MKTSIEELKLRCLMAVKELRKRGLRIKSDFNKMSHKQLTGEWSRLSAMINK
jgi:hypothetical protein